MKIYNLFRLLEEHQRQLCQLLALKIAIDELSLDNQSRTLFLESILSVSLDLNAQSLDSFKIVSQKLNQHYVVGDFVTSSQDG